MTDVNPAFVTQWIDCLEHDPLQALDSFSSIISALKKPRSTRNFRRLALQLDTCSDIFLLVEHCLIQHMKLSAMEGDGYNVHTIEYIRKMFAFLSIWVKVGEGALKRLFTSGVIQRNLLRFGVDEHTRSIPSIRYDLCSILKNYLNAECIDAHGFTQTEAGLEMMDEICEVFCMTCVHSGESKLLEMLLDSIRQCNFADHYDCLLDGTIGPYIVQCRYYLGQQVGKLEYEVNRAYFERQLQNCEAHYQKMICTSEKARILGLIASKLVIEEKREKYEIPAMKDVLFRELLDQYEPRKWLHTRFTEKLLGLDKELSPYETDYGKKQQADEPWAFWELHEDHVVYSYLARSGAVRKRSPCMMTAKRARACITEYMNRIRENAIQVAGSDDDDDDSMEESLARYFKQETERVILELLPEVVGDDIDFVDLSTDASSFSDEIESYSDSE